MDALSAVCVNITGIRNVYTGKDGRKYAYQIGAEREDGGISGMVYVFEEGEVTPETRQLPPMRRAGYFHIKPDGGIKRSPKSFPVHLYILEAGKVSA